MLRHCCWVLPSLRNVPLPFWRVSTFPSTIFGIRGVEESRRRARAAIAYYVSGDQTNQPWDKSHPLLDSALKREHSQRQAAWMIIGKLNGKLTTRTRLMRTDRSSGCMAFYVPTLHDEPRTKHCNTPSKRTSDKCMAWLKNLTKQYSFTWFYRFGLTYTNMQITP